MRIVAVIDVREGRAVHAHGGHRTAYAPVKVAAGRRVDGDVTALARAYVDGLGVRELYVADLDAIEGRCGLNVDVLPSICTLGVPVWADLGLSTPAGAEAVLDAGASTAIVGLETLSNFDNLAEICATVGAGRVAFSVDLRDGVPIALPNAVQRAWNATDVAVSAAAAGASSIIVLDLARVGTGSGIDLALMREVRAAVPGVTLLAAGGVRDSSDLERLASVGVDGALVATALLAGTIHV